MNAKITAASIGALMLMGSAAIAQTTAQVPSDAHLSAGDTDFLTNAAQGGMIEIQTSKLASMNSSNADVKKFGHEMIDDHSKADTELKKIAKKMMVKLPMQLDTAHQAEYDELKNVKGADFDQKFIAIQDKEHNAALNAFQTEATAGDNAKLKAFAAKTVPTLQTHMKKVKALEAKFPPAASSAPETSAPETSAPMTGETGGDER